jgi:uncharacterized protein (TIGR02652 family)
MNQSFQYPIFGPEITCPHCRQQIPALTLTDSYLCHRHGAFEADPKTEDLVHLQSGRHWRLWNNEWYRQHSHPDGIRFEIHEALDSLYRSGNQVTKIIIANRYEELISGYLERNSGDFKSFKLYNIPVEFSSESADDTRWNVINFDFETQPGVPQRYPYFRLFE